MDIESLKDYFIADQIQRIELLTRDELVRELISIKSAELEAMTPHDLLRLCETKKYGN